MDSMIRPNSNLLSGIIEASSDGVGLMDETAMVALPSCADASAGNSTAMNRLKQILRKEIILMTVTLIG